MVKSVHDNGKTTITVRIDQDWKRRVARLLNITKGKRSELIRQTMEREAILFLESPYFCRRAQHFVLVLSNGDIHHYKVEELELNDRIRSLQFGARMIPEMRTRLLYQDQGSGRGNVQDIRNHWMLNYFAVWKGETVESEFLGEATDRYGLAEKDANILIQQGADRFVTRESFAIWRDHVQYKESQVDTADDRVATRIEIPTREMEAHIVVDRGLYAENSSLCNSARTGIEFRNAESHYLKRRLLGAERKRSSRYEERFPDALCEDNSYRATLGAIKDRFDAYKARLQALTAKGRKAEDGQLLMAEQDRKRLRQLDELPDSYLFGHFEWPMPYIGTEVSFTWNKAERE